MRIDFPFGCCFLEPWKLRSPKNVGGVSSRHDLLCSIVRQQIRVLTQPQDCLSPFLRIQTEDVCSDTSYMYAEDLQHSRHEGG
jgi:hypothetical protein